MKAITLKMSANGFGQDREAGQRGDHRMCKVIIPLPRSKLKQIHSCIVLFVLDDNTPFRSDLILRETEGDISFADDSLHIVLLQQLTNCRALRMQVACFGDECGQMFICNTPISERILFAQSLHEGLDDVPEISGSPGLLLQLYEWMHSHPNESVLAAFAADESGRLHWNGEAIAKGADLQAEAEMRSNEDGELWGAIPTALTNTEINNIINQALAALH